MTSSPVPAKAPKLTPLKAFTGVFVAVFLFVLGGSALITFLLPESYASTTRVRTTAPGQAESFQSTATLEAVAKQLDLNRALGEQYGDRKPLPTDRTVDLLRRSLRVTPVRGTNLVEICVFDHSPTEAARLANAIAQTGIAQMTAATTNAASGAPQVVDAAEPARKPVRPNKALNLTLGALVGIFLGVMAGGVGARLGVRQAERSGQSHA